MNKTSILLAAVMTAGLTAKADFIDFESDPSSGVPNGWASSQSANVTFYDTSGAELSVSNFGSQGIGQSLAVFNDYDGSAIRMLFSQDYGSLSLAFGNDDPGWAQSDDFAVLFMYNDGNFIGQSAVQLSPDDVMNQTISWNSGAFDEAIFQYRDQSGNQLNLIEIIDNIEFGDGQAPVPEVQHYASMLGAVMAGAEMLRRRRSKA